MVRTKPSIEVLPSELLGSILHQVYTSRDQESGSILSCLLVCRQWRDLGLPILYRDLVLGSAQLPHFLAVFNQQAVSAFTQSLTIRLSWPQTATSDELSPGKLPDAWLRRLVQDVMDHMGPRLRSCCLSTSCPVSRATILAFLRALPASCVNLELDTENYDTDDLDNPFRHRDTDDVPDNAVHLCHELRGILPRLVQARLRLRTMCAAIVGTYNENHDFQALSLPSMDSLMISCIDGWGVGKRCHQQPRGVQSLEPTSWNSVIGALQQVSKTIRRSHVQLVVMGCVGGSEQDRRHHKTLLRCHVGQDITTRAFSVLNLPRIESLDNESPSIYYARTQDGGIVTGGYSLLQESIEGRLWRTLTTGTRLPADAAKVSQIPLRKEMVWPETEWREKYPRKSCLLWVNERKTGMRLVECEERHDFDLRGLVEETPDGWHRPVEHELALLVKDEQEF